MVHVSELSLYYYVRQQVYDMDKNVINRIETNRRYVTDIEIRALAHIFDVTCDYQIEGKE